jgi:hypothetical protein
LLTFDFLFKDPPIMKRISSCVLSATALAAGSLMGGAVWAQSYPPDPVFTIHAVADSFGPPDNGTVSGTQSATPSGNTVTVAGSLQGYVVGGMALDTPAAISGNTVFISGAAEIGYSGIGLYPGRAVYGAWTQGAGVATDNHVTFDGSAHVLGGDFANTPVNAVGLSAVGGIGGTATGNSVTLNTTGTFIGAAIVGGVGESEASNNTVTLNSGTVQVAGTPFAATYALGGGHVKGVGPLTANNNTVLITGGTVTGGVVAAATVNLSCPPAPPFPDPHYSYPYEAQNNTVDISGSPVFNSVALVGVQLTLTQPSPFSSCTPDPASAAVAENTLHLRSLVSAAGLSGFTDLNFYLPAGLQPNTPGATPGTPSTPPTTPMLTITNTTPGLTGVNVQSAPLAKNQTTPLTLSQGQTYTLIHYVAPLLPLATAFTGPNASADCPTGFLVPLPNPDTCTLTLTTGTIKDATGAVFPYTVKVWRARPADLVMELGASTLAPGNAVPATGPTALALLALGVLGLGAWTRRARWRTI